MGHGFHGYVSHNQRVTYYTVTHLVFRWKSRFEDLQILLRGLEKREVKAGEAMDGAVAAIAIENCTSSSLIYLLKMVN